MPGVFPLNDFSQLNAHGRLPRDLLTAPFTPPSLSPLHLFHLRLCTTPKPRPPTLDVADPPPSTRPRSSSIPARFPWAAQHAGTGAAPPFLGTKNQLIYVSESGRLEGLPFVFVDLSLSSRLRVTVHCCPVITAMCRIHVEL